MHVSVASFLIRNNSCETSLKAYDFINSKNPFQRVNLNCLILYIDIQISHFHLLIARLLPRLMQVKNIRILCSHSKGDDSF